MLNICLMIRKIVDTKPENCGNPLKEHRLMNVYLKSFKDTKIYHLVSDDFARFSSTIAQIGERILSALRLIKSLRRQNSAGQ